MASSSRRAARLTLAAVAVAVIGLGVWAWEPLYWWVITERVFTGHNDGDGGIVRGWYRIGRWSGRETRDGRAVTWFVSTGYRASETFFAGGFGRIGRTTIWKPSGSVQHQIGPTQWPGVPGWRTSPPWLWGVTDETEPSIPAWILDDERWQAALDAQRD